MIKDPPNVNRPFWKGPPTESKQTPQGYKSSNKPQSYFQQRSQCYNNHHNGNYKNHDKYDSKKNNLFQGDSISAPKGGVTICSRTGKKSYF